MERNGNKFLYLLFVALTIAGVISLYFDFIPISNAHITSRIGYFVSMYILFLGIVGLWLPKTHLFHHQIFKTMAYCGVVLLIITLLFSMARDLIILNQKPEINEAISKSVNTVSKKELPNAK